MWGVRVTKKSGKKFLDMCRHCYVKEEEIVSLRVN